MIQEIGDVSQDVFLSNVSGSGVDLTLPWKISASRKPHPSKPHSCNMPQVTVGFPYSCAAIFGKFRCRNCTATIFFFCNADVIFYQKLRCSKRKTALQHWKAALQESGAFLPLSCGFQAGTFRLPRLGPAENTWTWIILAKCLGRLQMILCRYIIEKYVIRIGGVFHENGGVSHTNLWHAERRAFAKV